MLSPRAGTDRPPREYTPSDPTMEPVKAAATDPPPLDLIRLLTSGVGIPATDTHEHGSHLVQGCHPGCMQGSCPRPSQDPRQGPGQNLRVRSILGVPPMNRVYDIILLGPDSFRIVESRDSSHEMTPHSSVWKNGQVKSRLPSVVAFPVASISDPAPALSAQECLRMRDFVDTVLWPALWSCGIGDTGARMDLAPSGVMCLMIGCNRAGQPCDCYVVSHHHRPMDSHPLLDRGHMRSASHHRAERSRDRSPYTRAR